MYDFALHKNINPLKNFNNSGNSQQKYWLSNHSAPVQTNAQSKKQKHKVTGLFVMGLALMFFSKGVQKNLKYSLKFLKGYFENKIDESVLDPTARKVTFYEYLAKKTNSIIKKSESINNFNSLKDILFMKLMSKTKITKKIHQNISKCFEYLSRRTITKSYKRTQKLFDNMNKHFDKLDNYIEKYILVNSGDEVVVFNNKKKTKQQLFEDAKSTRYWVQLIVNSFITPNTQDIRYKRMKNLTSKLYSNFWDESFRGFWTKENKFKRKEMWQTFIASEQVKTNKTDLAKDIALIRNMLSYTDAEKKMYISNYIDNLSSIIQVEDTKGTDIIKRLKWYIKEKSPLESNQKNLLDEIEKLEKLDIKTSPDENIAKAQLEDKATNIKLMRGIVNDSDNGEIGDMINIYKIIAPFEFYKSGALKSMQKSVTSFDKSLNLEIGEMFDKLRDLEIGSAPTDIMTILISTAMIIRAIEKAKSNDERSTIILKSGIPIAGAVATTLYSTTKLISGGKSLALGFISGLILNRIGTLLSEIKNEKYPLHTKKS